MGEVECVYHVFPLDKCGNSECIKNGRKVEMNYCLNCNLRKPFASTAKHDTGKAQISLVPPAIVEAIAEVRAYGNKKYGDPENWRTVEKQRYIDAMLRHTLEFMRGPNSTDQESGLKHSWHMACNLAFILEIERND
jgi:hypothetical protein